MSIGFHSALNGAHKQAIRCYEYGQEMIDTLSLETPVDINPELSMLRHKQGRANGIITAYPPEEDMVMSIEFADMTHQSTDAIGMQKAVINKEALTRNIKEYQYTLSDYQKDNIYKELPHIMILSTGRVGTVSLFRLLERTQYMPFHSYFYQPSKVHRKELMCRFISGNKGDGKLESDWITTRLSEWIGGCNVNRPLAMLNHLDTIYSPVMAQIHPKSKFVFLRRDPESVFKSFYSKNQWRSQQPEPMYFKFDPDFKYRLARLDLPATIAWYIKFTEVFSRALGSVYPDRFIEISSDNLFQQDENEIRKLSEFMKLPLTVDEIADHFSIPINEKKHKINKSDTQIEYGLESFKRAYDAL
jgi:hypothetical protein